MSDEALQRLLARSGDVGEVESSAQFTLAPEKALEKLSAYQLPDPGLRPGSLLLPGAPSRVAWGRLPNRPEKSPLQKLRVRMS